MITILILAAGKNSHPSEMDYPLCLTEIKGKNLLELILNSCRNFQKNIVVALDEQERKLFFLDNIVKILNSEAQIFSVPENTAGAACTALLSTNYIQENDELLIINTNQFVDLDLELPIEYFRSNNLDAGTVIFQSINSRYSFVQISEQNLVIEAAEKRVISNWATAGIYWYKHGIDFVESCKETIIKDARVNNKFYICPTLNEMILNQKTVGVYKIDSEKYLPLKNERQIHLVELK